MLDRIKIKQLKWIKVGIQNNHSLSLLTWNLELSIIYFDNKPDIWPITGQSILTTCSIPFLRTMNKWSDVSKVCSKRPVFWGKLKSLKTFDFVIYFSTETGFCWDKWQRMWRPKRSITFWRHLERMRISKLSEYWASKLIFANCFYDSSLVTI